MVRAPIIRDHEPQVMISAQKTLSFHDRGDLGVAGGVVI